MTHSADRLCIEGSNISLMLVVSELGGGAKLKKLWMCTMPWQFIGDSLELCLEV